MSPDRLQEVCAGFRFRGDVRGIEPYGNGHINRTYAVSVDQGGRPVRYVLQALNTNVFREPLALMANVEAVTRHLAGRLAARGAADASRRGLTLVPTCEDRACLVDGDGGVWRAYVFIEGATSHDLIREPRQAFEAARAFGRFQADLADYAGPRLAETIPCFHHTPRRLAALLAAVEADPCNRAAGVESELAWALGREPLAHVLQTPFEAGRLPERITHNDTKLNNVLLDDQTGEGLCVLDLDTVMPGLALCDFGDMVRSACNPVAEDERDVSRVQARVPVFEALARGFLEGTAGALTPLERSLLVAVGQVLTYECGLRFLTDHLLGDTYFRIHRPDHNLDRCRTQFALVRSLEAQEDRLQRFVETLP